MESCKVIIIMVKFVLKKKSQNLDSADHSKNLSRQKSHYAMQTLRI